MNLIRRLLVVDPTGAVPDLTPNMQPGWAVDHTRDLDQARLQLLSKHHQVGLVAWDLGEGRLGIDLLRDLNREECALPILLAADAEHPEHAEAALEAGAADCVPVSDPARCAQSISFAHAAHARSERRSARLLSLLGASLAHEGKNALAGIGGALQILSDLSDAEPPLVLGEVRQRLGELTSFVDSLGFVMRQSTPQQAPVSVSSLLEGMGGRIELLGEELVLRGDPHHLTRMLASLLQAAGLRDARVRLEAHSDRSPHGQPHGELRLACPSLPPDSERLLAQSDALANAGRRGLDLFLASRVAEAHGGKLTVDMNTTEVIVRLPLWASTADSANAPTGAET